MPCRLHLAAFLASSVFTGWTHAQSLDPETMLWNAPEPRAGDRFGASVLVVDLDADGHGEVLVGAPAADADGDAQRDEGVVYIARGPVSRTPRWERLEAPLSRRPMKPSPGRNAPRNERVIPEFGYWMESGDFDGDGNIDLAVASPGVDVDFVDRDQGEVFIFFGPWDLSRPSGWSDWTSVLEPTRNDGVRSAFGDRFGHRMTVGDFDGDGADDLAVGAPFSDCPVGFSRITLCGEAWLYFGAVTPATPFSRVEELVHAFPEADTLWGLDMAAGNVRDSNGFAGFDDLLCAAYNGQPLGNPPNSGHVTIFYDWPATQSFSRKVELFQSPAPRLGACFGWSVEVGNLDGVPPLDIAVAAPGSFGAGPRNGEVQVFAGSNQGLSFPYVGTFTASPPTLAEDLFGRATGWMDIDGDGLDELAIGAPWYEIQPAPGTHGAGRVWLRDTTTASRRVFDDPTPEQLTSVAGWGDSMAHGHLSADRRPDLVIGNARASALAGGRLRPGAGEVLVALFR